MGSASLQYAGQHIHPSESKGVQGAGWGMSGTEYTMGGGGGVNLSPESSPEVTRQLSGNFFAICPRDTIRKCILPQASPQTVREPKIGPAELFQNNAKSGKLQSLTGF